jgi:hypothetical protein
MRKKIENIIIALVSDRGCDKHTFNKVVDQLLQLMEQHSEAIDTQHRPKQ